MARRRSFLSAVNAIAREVERQARAQERENKRIQKELERRERERLRAEKLAAKKRAEYEKQCAIERVLKELNKAEKILSERNSSIENYLLLSKDKKFAFSFDELYSSEDFNVLKPVLKCNMPSTSPVRQDKYSILFNNIKTRNDKWKNEIQTSYFMYSFISKIKTKLALKILNFAQKTDIFLGLLLTAFILLASIIETFASKNLSDFPFVIPVVVLVFWFNFTPVVYFGIKKFNPIIDSLLIKSYYLRLGFSGLLFFVSLIMFLSSVEKGALIPLFISAVPLLSFYFNKAKNIATKEAENKLCALKKARANYNKLKIEFVNDCRKWIIEAIKTKIKNAENKILYEQQCNDWEKQKIEFYEKQNRLNQNIDDYKKDFESCKKEPVELYFGNIINQIEQPIDCECKYELFYNETSSTLEIKYQLPRYEIFPNIKELSYVKTKNEIKEVYFSETANKKRYEDYIYKLILSVIAIVFNSDKVNAVNTIVFKANVQNIQRIINVGFENNTLNLAITKNQFDKLDLKYLDPKAIFKANNTLASTMNISEAESIVQPKENNKINNSNLKFANNISKSTKEKDSLVENKKNIIINETINNSSLAPQTISDEVKNLSPEIQANLSINIESDNQQAKSYNKSSKLKFYTKTDTIELFGYKITNSIFYTCDTKSSMPFAINTNIRPSFENTSSTWLGYWPNYSELNRNEKGCYIKWLAEGKPYINELGYAYIYFYGLEYRALIEKQDLKLILFEVIELVNKFKQLRYGFDFIVYLIFAIKDFSQNENDILLKFLKDNERKYLYNEEYNSLIKLLTPKEKYKVKFLPYQFLNNNEYNNLSDRKNEILSYYLDKIIDNLDEKEIYTTKKQNYAYYMAMQGYYGTKVVAYEPIVPSIKLKRLWNQARKIIKEKITQTVKNFDSSSKSLTEIEKLAYLPAELRKNINYSIDNFRFDEKQITNISIIAKKLKFKMQDKLTFRQSSLIVDACEALGYSIEPNANINKKAYKKDAEILLYKTQNSENQLSNNYQIASLFMDIGYQIALEDNELLETEIAYIENYIQNEFNLSDSEKLRLKMRGELIVHTKEINTSETIKKLIGTLEDTGKETIAQYIISVAMADGIVKDKELKILHKIFKQFDFSEEYLASTLSKLIGNTDEIVIVEKGVTTNKKGSKIPSNIDTAEKIEFKLDIEKLEKIKTNTSEIHNVLQEIFADEQAQELKLEPIELVLAEDEEKLESENGLQSIINIIIEKETWTRNELLNVIQGKGLMLGSVIESINEWSEEEFGDFLVEEDEDTYILNQDVVSLMNSKR